MAQQRSGGARPQDMTGRRKEELAKEHAAAVATAAESMSLLNAHEAELLETEIIDTTLPVQPPAPEGPTELLEYDGSTIVEEPTKVIVLNEDCDPTIGAGNHYEFKAGRQYRVPAFVASHLDSKGLVRH